MSKTPGQFRKGKTAREHKNNTWHNRFVNRETRTTWQNDPKRTQANFPFFTCNGKRNRSLNNKGNPITVVSQMR